jgi:hypothetical protein
MEDIGIRAKVLRVCEKLGLGLCTPTHGLNF